jgi:tetratricopeptide (TPR) repeat protein
VSYFLIGILSAAITASPPAAVTNVAPQSAGTSVIETDSKDSVEKEFQKLMADDDAAQAEVDLWIRQNNEFAEKGAGVSAADLRRRIQKRFEPVRQAYEDFLQRHPKHSRARVAYASFLGDIKDEDGAQEQLEKALEVDTNNPAIYNNLANIHGHTGSVKKAFEYYTKAIQLNPLEPVYYHNFGTTVYLFRTDAKEYYGITEEQVFAKAFELYSNAMRLDPENFPLASDVAQSYYGVQPMRTEEALKAWTNALHLAHDEIEREGVYIHFARIKLMAGRFAETHAHLNAVTNEMYLELKKRLTRNLEAKEHPAKDTNAPSPEIQNPKLEIRNKSE